jgi:hypothetical protein
MSTGSRRFLRVRSNGSRVRGMARADWLLLVASTAVSLALLEIFLRLWFPLFPSPYQADDVLLTKLVPGASKAFTRLAVNGGQRIVSHINSQGFRGEELRAPVGQKRVIVYGDSNVQAEFSELAATFPKQLELRLAPSFGTGVEVINAGVVGYGPDQYSLRLAADLEKLRPALVVAVIFADNDFGDLIRNRIYRLNSRGKIELTPHPLAPQMKARLRAAAYPRGLRGLQTERYAARLWSLALNKWSAVHGSAYDTDRFLYVDQSLANRQTYYRDYMADSAHIGYVENPFDDYYDADIALQPDSASARYKVALMEQVLINLRDSAARAAAKLVLVILPSAIDACDGYYFQVNTSKYPQYDRARLSGVLEAMAMRNGIAYLNLFPAFRAQDANLYYFHGGDDHWNDAGQARAAQMLADLIARDQLLGPPPPAGAEHGLQ